MKRATGAISGGHAETVKAGQLILEDGGNAFDAMLAALFASFVAEPCMSSPGGGLFILYKTASGKASLIDGFCQTPGRKLPLEKIDFRKIPIDFGTVIEDFYAGSGAIAVPGAIAAACRLHELHCSMPLPVLLEPAVALAKEGLEIDSFQAYDFKLLESILRIDEVAAGDFFKEGKLKQMGDTMVLPELADFLEVLGKEGPRLFYEGEIAQEVIKASGENAQLSINDFRQFEAIEREPLLLKFGDWSVHSNPAPSGGGSRILTFLSMAMGNAFTRVHPAARAIWLKAIYNYSDPTNKPSPESGLIEAIGRIEGHHIFDAPTWNGKLGSTSHINTVDADGNTVSLTSSNGEGSGIWVSGIQFNNMLGEAALFPAGFQSWKTNARIGSLMSPTIASRGKEIVALGSGGASRIPSAIGQTLLNFFTEGCSIEEAVSWPRMHWQENRLDCEPPIDAAHFPPSFRDAYTRWDRPDMYFGGVHAIRKDGNSFSAVGDDRRNGAAKVI